VEGVNDIMSPRTKNDATQRNIDAVLANLPQTANRHMVGNKFIKILRPQGAKF
jgi:hypothetical protein